MLGKYMYIIYLFLLFQNPRLCKVGQIVDGDIWHSEHCTRGRPLTDCAGARQTLWTDHGRAPPPPPSLRSLGAALDSVGRSRMIIAGDASGPDNPSGSFHNRDSEFPGGK